MSIRRAMMWSLNNATLTQQKIQLFFVGDSITGGIGTTGTGSSASGNFNGGNDYPSKTMELLSGLDVTPVVRTFPGQTGLWYTDYDLNRTCRLFDKDNYTDIYVVLFIGANDLLLYDDVAFRGIVQDVCNKYKSVGAKVIVIPVLSRKDTFAESVSYVNIERRNLFNAWLYANYNTFCDGYVDLTGHPELFGDDAPDDATYFNSADVDSLSKVHPTDAGAQILANCVAPEILRLSGTASTITPIDEAAVFLDATGITDPTIITAVNTLVNDLKVNNLWYKLDAIYPFVGGTWDTHKFNLRDARDTDDAFRLVYTGSHTHDSNGITFSSTAGSNVDTKYIPSGSVQLARQASLSFYNRTAIPSTYGGDMGIYTGSNAHWLIIKFGTNGSYRALNDNGTNAVSVSYSEQGLFTNSRNNDQVKRSFYRNGVLVADDSSATFSAVDYGAKSIYLGNLNNNDLPCNRNCAYASIGLGLSASEEALHYTIIQAFQTALGRAV